MPLFMDVHQINGGVAMEDVAKAHLADLRTQAAYDVRYLRYWVDEPGGRVFCLVEAPRRRPPPASTERPVLWSPTTSTRSRKVPSEENDNASKVHRAARRHRTRRRVRQ